MSEPNPHVPPPEPPDATAEDFMIFRNKRPREPILLPNGKRAWAVGLLPLEKHEWYNSCTKVVGNDGVERIQDPWADAKLVVRSIRNSAGVLLFTDADLTKVIEWPPVLLSPIVDKCLKVSAIGGAVDGEILKNFVATLTAGS